MRFNLALATLIAVPALAVAYLNPHQEAHLHARRAAIDAYYDTLYARDLDFKEDYSIYARDADNDELELTTREIEDILGKRDVAYLKCQSCKKNTTKMSSVRCPNCGKGPLTKITKPGAMHKRAAEPVGAFVGV